MSDVNKQDSEELDEPDELDDQDDAEELGEDEEIDAEEFDDEPDEYADDPQVVEVVLSPKEQNARSLAVRKAIEQRMERKQLDEDLDYLDLDLDE